MRLLMILGMALVTYLTRGPALILLRGDLPSWLTRWLQFVPIAVFTALVVPSFVTVPLVAPVTRPDALTSATPVLLLDQVKLLPPTALPEAFFAWAESWSVAPASMVAEGAVTVTSATLVSTPVPPPLSPGQAASVAPSASVPPVRARRSAREEIVVCAMRWKSAGREEGWTPRDG